MMTEQSEFCWRCQEKSSILGHVTKNCPLIQCKKCFKFGHIISNCLSKIKLEKEQDLFKIKATNSSTGQKIPALLQNQHFTALFILENVPSHIKRVHITPSKIGHPFFKLIPALALVLAGNQIRVSFEIRQSLPAKRVFVAGDLIDTFVCTGVMTNEAKEEPLEDKTEASLKIGPDQDKKSLDPDHEMNIASRKKKRKRIVFEEKSPNYCPKLDQKSYQNWSLAIQIEDAQLLEQMIKLQEAMIALEPRLKSAQVSMNRAHVSLLNFQADDIKTVEEILDDHLEEWAQANLTKLDHWLQADQIEMDLENFSTSQLLNFSIFQIWVH